MCHLCLQDCSVWRGDTSVAQLPAAAAAPAPYIKMCREAQRRPQGLPLCALSSLLVPLLQTGCMVRPHFDHCALQPVTAVFHWGPSTLCQLCSAQGGADGRSHCTLPLSRHWGTVVPVAKSPKQAVHIIFHAVL